MISHRVFSVQLHNGLVLVNHGSRVLGFQLQCNFLARRYCLCLIVSELRVALALLNQFVRVYLRPNRGFGCVPIDVPYLDPFSAWILLGIQYLPKVFALSAALALSVEYGLLLGLYQLLRLLQHLFVDHASRFKYLNLPITFPLM